MPVAVVGPPGLEGGRGSRSTSLGQARSTRRRTRKKHGWARTDEAKTSSSSSGAAGTGLGTTASPRELSSHSEVEDHQEQSVVLNGLRHHVMRLHRQMREIRNEVDDLRGGVFSPKAAEQLEATDYEELEQSAGSAEATH